MIIKAVVQKIIREGKHGSFVVATSNQLEGSVTFSLEPTVWKEKEWPEEGTMVFLGELRQKRAGWRAKQGRFWKPSDEQTQQTERSKAMSFSITYPETDEVRVVDCGSSYGAIHSPTRDTPAKLLIARKNDGLLIPCNYKSCSSSDDTDGHSEWKEYVPSENKPIDPKDLVEVQNITFETKYSAEDTRSGFHEFVVNLMEHPPENGRFIQYLGIKTVTLLRNFIGIRRTRFVHRFFLCRLRAPLDEKYEARVTEKKHQVAERRSNLKRLEQELSSLSLSEYLKVSGQEIEIFDIVPLEHSEEKEIPSGGSLLSIDKLVKLAKNNFVKKTPCRTEQVVAVQEEIVEIPSTFWVRGKQRITYHGVALVLKKEDY